MTQELDPEGLPVQQRARNRAEAGEWSGEWHGKYVVEKARADSLAEELRVLNTRFDLELDAYAKDHDIAEANKRADSLAEQLAEAKTGRLNRDDRHDNDLWEIQADKFKARAETAEAQLAVLRGVLMPFAEQADTHGEQVPDSMFIDDYERAPWRAWYSLAGITVGDLRRARDAWKGDFNRAAALSGTDAAPTAVETYKAENVKNGWTGRGLSFDGGCLNLGKDGSAEFVFDMDDCDPYYEEGKSLMLVKVPPSEIEFLRDYLVKAFPAARTDAATGGGDEH